jgi:hypothetical protein
VVKLLASSIYGCELLLKFIIVLFTRSRFPCSIVYKSESDYVIRPPPLPIPLRLIKFLDGRCDSLVVLPGVRLFALLDCLRDQKSALLNSLFFISCIILAS